MSASLSTIILTNRKLRVLIACLVFLILASCNPYEPYPITHYNISASIEPDQARISANVQMVLVTRQEYRDSICFSLNPGVKIHALTAQVLRYYEFYDRDTCNLVLYIEDPVGPGEQLSISLSYEGQLSDELLISMDSSLYWYPVNNGSHPATFQAEFSLPGNWQISEPLIVPGKHGKRLYQSRLPRNSLSIIFTAE